MNTRFCKSLFAVCLYSIFASALPIAFGQDQSGQGQGPAFQGQGGRTFGGGFGRFGGAFITNSVRFDVDIENGRLSLAPLKGRVDINEFNLGAGAQPAEIDSVPATIANLAKYLRAA